VKYRILNLALVVTSLIGYLEWGADNRSFLFEAERIAIEQLFSNPESIVHPFVLIPLFGQLLLLSSAFLKRPNRFLTYAGIACLGLLLGLMFFIGVIELNIKILASTLPFLVLSTYVIVLTSRHSR
jgi:cobalamin biosynthesis protein CobD/CbiB